MTKALVLMSLVLLPFTATPVPREAGQSSDPWCTQDRPSSDRAWYCEVREETLSAPSGRLTVDAGPNGGIRLQGWGQPTIQLRARVRASADDEAAARGIAEQVRLNIGSDRVDVEGPRTRGHEGWEVSLRISAPSQTGFSLQTRNGGIEIENMQSAIDFETVNGGVKLTNLGGNVRGRTSNGGVDVDLQGERWNGQGLDVSTQNGGVRVTLPSNYSAHLETSTVNGGLDIDFPVTVQGRIDREISVDLGAGGPPIRARTHNGGVKIRRR